MKTPPQKHTSGFTLIEVLVMTGITVILLLSATTIFMTFLVNQSLVMQKQKIKIDGDNALKQMTQMLREAREVVNCDDVSADQEIIYKNISGEVSTFSVMEDSGTQRIASASGEPVATTFLTSGEFEVSDFSPDCMEENEAYLVTVTFNLTDNSLSFSQNPLQQNFTTKVSLRN